MMLRYMMVAAFLTLSVCFTGCGGGSDSPPGTVSPTIPAMASSNYNMETAVISCGGGSASSTSYNCTATISASAGTCMSQGYLCEAGFQNTTVE